MPRRSPTLSATVLRDRLAALDHRLEVVERDSHALLDALHPSQRRSGANLLHYLALRG